MHEEMPQSMNKPVDPALSSPVPHVRRYHGELQELRRDLHAHPELGFQESRTSSIVAEKLAAWGIEVHRGMARTGLVGVVRGKGRGTKSVGLRADMDCLPMHETGTVPYRSKHEGRMHACGHDGHTAMLLGAARYLAETRNFDGTAYLIFQPAEEGGGGGRVMVQEGLFKRFPADEIYALHNFPALEAGKMAVRAGPMMAASDEVKIAIRGTGGHGAFPHLTVDPVVAAAHVITALQTIASRNADPVDAIVVSICSMATSQIGAFNVIPESVQLAGTVRTFKNGTRDLAEKRVTEIVTKVAEAFGARADVEYLRGYPATTNSVRESEFAARVGARIFGPDNVITDFDPVMGGEDFSYMLLERPGAYVFLGQGGGPSGCFLHNSNYDFNDAVIPLGAGYLAALVEDALTVR
jgi:amidohydrolase